jgi:hypothetical protein
MFFKSRECVINFVIVATIYKDGECSPAQQMNALRVTFRDRRLVFRYYPAAFNSLRWQAGRTICEPITMSDGSVQMIERFELIAFGCTSQELTDQLA